MRKYFIFLFGVFISFVVSTVYSTTHRVAEFSNEKVNVWQTTIYPGASQKLKMHRHEYNRVLVAFDDGILKIKNDKGQIHYLKLAKNKAYYLAKDIPAEVHTDENISHHPIKILVIELKN